MIKASQGSIRQTLDQSNSFAVFSCLETLKLNFQEAPHASIGYVRSGRGVPSGGLGLKLEELLLQVARQHSARISQVRRKTVVAEKKVTVAIELRSDEKIQSGTD